MNWFSYNPFVCTASGSDREENSREENETGSVIYNKKTEEKA